MENGTIGFLVHENEIDQLRDAGREGEKWKSINYVTQGGRGNLCENEIDQFCQIGWLRLARSGMHSRKFFATGFGDRAVDGPVKV
jgi:hypothetical protein